MRKMVLAGVAVLLLAACDPSGHAHAPAPGSPSPSAGSDLADCADGVCHVVVGAPVEIPLDGRDGLTAFSISKIEKGQVHYTTASPGGGNAGAVGAGCTMTFGDHRDATVCGSGRGGQRAIKGQVISVDAVDGDRAVLDLSRRA